MTTGESLNYRSLSLPERRYTKINDPYLWETDPQQYLDLLLERVWTIHDPFHWDIWHFWQTTPVPPPPCNRDDCQLVCDATAASASLLCLAMGALGPVGVAASIICEAAVIAAAVLCNMECRICQ